MLARLADPLRVRWIVLRGLGIIHLSVFWSLAGRIHGLIGPHGLLPVGGFMTLLRAKAASSSSAVRMMPKVFITHNAPLDCPAGRPALCSCHHLALTSFAPTTRTTGVK